MKFTKQATASQLQAIVDRAHARSTPATAYWRWKSHRNELIRPTASASAAHGHRVPAQHGAPHGGPAAFEQALRLDPFDLNWLPWLRAIVYYDAHRYAEAIKDLEGIDVPVGEAFYYRMASYAQAGRLEEAGALVAPFLAFAEEDMAVFPGRRLGDWEPFLRSTNVHRGEAVVLHLLEGLRKAGFPE